MPDFITLANAPNVNILISLKPGIYGELARLARQLNMPSPEQLIKELLAFRLDIDIEHFEKEDIKCSSKY